MRGVVRISTVTVCWNNFSIFIPVSVFCLGKRLPLGLQVQPSEWTSDLRKIIATTKEFRLLLGVKNVSKAFLTVAAKGLYQVYLGKIEDEIDIFLT